VFTNLVDGYSHNPVRERVNVCAFPQLLDHLNQNLLRNVLGILLMTHQAAYHLRNQRTCMVDNFSYSIFQTFLQFRQFISRSACGEAA
jgi:hypothetical protein